MKWNFPWEKKATGEAVQTALNEFLDVEAVDSSAEYLVEEENNEEYEESFIDDSDHQVEVDEERLYLRGLDSFESNLLISPLNILEDIVESINPEENLLITSENILEDIPQESIPSPQGSPRLNIFLI